MLDNKLHACEYVVYRHMQSMYVQNFKQNKSDTQAALSIEIQEHELQGAYSFFSSTTAKESNRFGMSTQSFMHKPSFMQDIK